MYTFFNSKIFKLFLKNLWNIIILITLIFLVYSTLYMWNILDKLWIDLTKINNKVTLIDNCCKDTDNLKLIFGLASLVTGIAFISTYAVFNAIVGNTKEELKVYKDEINNRVDIFNTYVKSFDNRILLINPLDFLLLKFLSDDVASSEKYKVLKEIDSFLYLNSVKDKNVKEDFSYLIITLQNYYKRFKNDSSINNEKYFMFLGKLLLDYENVNE